MEKVASAALECAGGPPACARLWAVLQGLSETWPPTARGTHTAGLQLPAPRVANATSLRPRQFHKDSHRPCEAGEGVWTSLYAI